MVSAVLTLAASALLAGAAYAGVTVTALAVLVVQVSLAATWHRLSSAPGERGGIAVAVLAGLAADVVLLFDDEGGRIGPVVAVAAMVVPAAFVHQIARRDGRARLVTSLSATVVAGVLCVGLAAAIPMARTDSGRDALAIGLAAVAAATVASSRFGPIAGVVVGPMIGAVLAAALRVEFWPAMALAGVTALLAVAAVRVVRLGGYAARIAVLSTAALPLALAVPAAYVMESVLFA